MNSHNHTVSNSSQTWVKAESGTTYLCPVDALAGIENPTEADFQRLCLDESLNPQNG